MKKKMFAVILGLLMVSSLSFALEAPILYAPDSVMIGQDAIFGVDALGQNSLVAYCFGDSSCTAAECTDFLDPGWTVYHMYSDLGTFCVQAVLSTPDWKEQAWSSPSYVKVVLDAPIIYGPSYAKTGEDVSFQAQNFLFDVEQRFNFGDDGTVTDWCGPSCVFYHTFWYSGSFMVGAQSRTKDLAYVSDWSWSWVNVSGMPMMLQVNLTELICEVPKDLKVTMWDTKGNVLSGDVCVFGSGHDECYWTPGPLILPDFKAFTSEEVTVWADSEGYEPETRTILVQLALMKVQIHLYKGHRGEPNQLVIYVKNRKTKAGVNLAAVSLDGAVTDLLYTDECGKVERFFFDKGCISIKIFKDGYEPYYTKKVIR